MNKFDAFLARLAILLLIAWAIWFTKRLGVTPQEIGQAVKTFNANFGPALPSREKKP